jgi:hypothetical protein
MGLRRSAYSVFAGVCLVAVQTAVALAACGEVVTLDTHDGTSAKYSLAGVSANATMALVLLPGGGGFLNLDDDGCPRKLKGNSLTRKRPLFHAAGIVTALVDAPSDRQGRDGLGGFRVTAGHARDIGKVIADVRRRTGLPVWLAGSSRGTISATNAAARLSGKMAPDGIVLSSPVTSGHHGAFKAWVADTVFSNDLDEIKLPVLVVVHAEDKCIRTPPELGDDILEKTNSPREQAVTVTGGPGWDGGVSVKACKGRSPHGFVDQEEDVAAGIVRFIRGGTY